MSPKRLTFYVSLVALGCFFAFSNQEFLQLLILVLLVRLDYGQHRSKAAAMVTTTLTEFRLRAIERHLQVPSTTFDAVFEDMKAGTPPAAWSLLEREMSASLAAQPNEVP